MPMMSLKRHSARNGYTHGSITCLPITSKLQLHWILLITITITIAFSCL